MCPPRRIILTEKWVFPRRRIACIVVVSGGRDQRRRRAEELFRPPGTLRYVRQGLVQAKGAGGGPLLRVSNYGSGML